MTREQIIAEARSWIDTPFHHQGRLRGVGVDCIGVGVGVVRAFDVPVTDQPGYPRQAFGRRLEQALAAHCTRVENAQPGDFVLMRFAGEPQHVGIECGETFVHCWEKAGRCVEQRWTPKWRRRVVAAYALPGVSD